MSASGSTASGSEGISENKGPTIIYKIQPIVNIYLNTDGETSVAWK